MNYLDLCYGILAFGAVFALLSIITFIIPFMSYDRSIKNLIYHKGTTPFFFPILSFMCIAISISMLMTIS